MPTLLGSLSEVGGFLPASVRPGFPPRWQCGSWSYGWLHGMPIWECGARTSRFRWCCGTSCCRVTSFPRHRLFGNFILFCGTTHLAEAIIFWWPAYPAGRHSQATHRVDLLGHSRGRSARAPRFWGCAVGGTGSDRSERTAELSREIAERKRAEGSLIEQERTASNPREHWRRCLATDVHSQVTFINAIAEKLTGWTVAEARGKPLTESFQSSMSAPQAGCSS